MGDRRHVICYNPAHARSCRCVARCCSHAKQRAAGSMKQPWQHVRPTAETAAGQNMRAAAAIYGCQALTALQTPSLQPPPSYITLGGSPSCRRLPLSPCKPTATDARTRAHTQMKHDRVLHTDPATASTAQLTTTAAPTPLFFMEKNTHQ